MYEMYETMPPPPTKIMKMYEEGPSRRESDSKMHEMGGGGYPRLPRINAW